MKSEIRQVEEISVAMDGKEGRHLFAALDYVLTSGGSVFDLEQEESNALSALYMSLHGAFMANIKKG